jgi:peptide-methionine (S)-S-oxide reductase
MAFRFRQKRSTTSSNPTSAPQTAPPLLGAGPRGAERATFAAGCFWGVEAAFRGIEGVVQTAVGYTGGHTPRPTYEQVCGHATRHAEAVEVWFDPARVTYEQLLETFWQIHNPTTLDRQGFDFGNQYRSAIFFHSPSQEATAVASREREQANRRRKIVTEIVPASAFYRAEEYHQRYFEKSGRASCAASLRPAPPRATAA